MIGMIAPGTTVEARYVGDEGDFSRYRFSVNGTDVVDALVDGSDPRLEICIGTAGCKLSRRLSTNSVATLTLKEVPATDGSGIPDGFTQRVSGMSVYSYAVPRLMRFVVALHVTAVTGTSYRSL